MRYKFFTTTCFLAFIMGSSALYAQDSAPRREVGLQFTGLNFNGNSSFSVFLKKEKKENVYRRLRFFYGNLDAMATGDNSSFSMNAGIGIGREKRKTLDNKLQFYQGPECSATLGLTTVNWDNTTMGVHVRFGWVLGLQHSFTERWAINLEMIPGVGAGVFTNRDSDPRLVFDASISNNVSLGIARKF